MFSDTVYVDGEWDIDIEVKTDPVFGRVLKIALGDTDTYLDSVEVDSLISALKDARESLHND